MQEALDGDAVVAVALGEAVRRIGPDLVTDPRRVQGCLNDELAGRARAHRAEIDAIVVAAEEDIPTALTTERFDRPAAMQRLSERGLTDDVATFSIEAWHHSLGLDEPGTPPPSLTRTESTPAIDLGAEHPAGHPDVEAPAFPPPSGPPLPPPTVLPPDPPTAEGQRPSRRLRLLAPLGAFVVLVVVVAAIGLTRGGDDTTEAVTPPPATATLTFPVTALPWGAELTRTWTADEDELTGELRFTNPSGAPITGSHLEAIPKSMAATADLVRSEPAHTVVVEDPILQWDLTVEASATTVVTYRIALDGQVDDQQLEAWKGEQAEALAAHQAGLDTTAPTFAIVDPPDGSVLTESEIVVTGTGEPGTLLNFHGTDVPVDAAGAWSYPVGLAEGQNAFELFAHDTAGNRSPTVVYHLGYTSPPAGGGAPSNPGGSSGGGNPGGGGTPGGGGSTPAPAPAPAPAPGGGGTPAPPPPPPPPPRVTCWDGSTAASQAGCPAQVLEPSFSLNGPTAVYVGNTYHYSVVAHANVESCEMTARGNEWIWTRGLNVPFSNPGPGYEVKAICYSSTGHSSQRNLYITAY